MFLPHSPNSLNRLFTGTNLDKLPFQSGPQSVYGYHGFGKPTTRLCVFSDIWPVLHIAPPNGFC